MSDLPGRDATLDAAAREAFLAEGATLASPECAPDETIWRAAHGELPPDEVAALLDHAAGCPACVEAWRLARELSAPARRTLPRWAPLAAIAAGLLLIAVLVPRAARETEPAYRAAATAAIEARIGEEQVLSRSDARLAWSPGPAGTRYRLILASEPGEVIATVRDLEAAEYVVPGESLAGVPPGGALLWRVVATLPDGTELSSVTFRHRVE